MTIRAERIRDGHQETFTDVEWAKMVDRGDARKWKVIKRIAEPPAEIAAAVASLRKKKAESEPVEEDKPVKGKDEENE